MRLAMEAHKDSPAKRALPPGLKRDHRYRHADHTDFCPLHRLLRRKHLNMFAAPVRQGRGVLLQQVMISGAFMIEPGFAKSHNMGRQAAFGRLVCRGL